MNRKLLAAHSAVMAVGFFIVLRGGPLWVLPATFGAGAALLIAGLLRTGIEG